MMDFRRESKEQQNEGNDGYIWSKRLPVYVALALALITALASVSSAAAGGFMGFGG